MKKLFVFALSFLFASCSSFTKINKDNTGPCSWNLVYYNSDQGATLKGSLKNLISAVRNGKQIRIVMEKDSVVSAADAEFLWIKDGIVYAQNNSQVSSHFSGNDLIYIDNSYYWMFIVNTKGQRNAIRWSVGEHTMRGKSEDNIFIKWYSKN